MMIMKCCFFLLGTPVGLLLARHSIAG